MSLRLSVAMNSPGRGGVVVGAGVVAVMPPPEGAAAPAGAGAPGAGADAPLVAGRLGHPTRNRVRISTGITRSALPRRWIIGGVLLVNVPVDGFGLPGPILSRKTR